MHLIIEEVFVSLWPFLLAYVWLGPGFLVSQGTFSLLYSLKCSHNWRGGFFLQHEAGNWGLKPAVCLVNGSSGKWTEMNHWKQLCGWTCFGSWPLFAIIAAENNQPVLNFTYIFSSKSDLKVLSHFRFSWKSYLSVCRRVRDKNRKGEKRERDWDRERIRLPIYLWYLISFFSTFAVLAIKEVMSGIK